MTGRFGRRALGSLSAAALIWSAGFSSGVAQPLDYRQMTEAPPSWGQFAKLVRYRFDQWLAATDTEAARFRTYLKAHTGTSDGPPSLLTVQVWINPDGAVRRVHFPGLPDEGANRDLTAILTRGNIGEAPPPDMLQPIRLRLSLRGS